MLHSLRWFLCDDGVPLSQLVMFSCTVDEFGKYLNCIGLNSERLFLEAEGSNGATFALVTAPSRGSRKSSRFLRCTLPYQRFIYEYDFLIEA